MVIKQKKLKLKQLLKSKYDKNNLILKYINLKDYLIKWKYS